MMDKFEKILLEKYKSKIHSTVGRVDKLGNAIEMRLTYEEFKILWAEFGRLPGHPYVISRKDDIGHYEINNVFIQHTRDNSTQAMGHNTELDKKINDYCIKTGYKRMIVRNMIKRGELEL